MCFTICRRTPHTTLHYQWWWILLSRCHCWRKVQLPVWSFSVFGKRSCSSFQSTKYLVLAQLLWGLVYVLVMVVVAFNVPSNQFWLVCVRNNPMVCPRIRWQGPVIVQGMPKYVHSFHILWESYFCVTWFWLMVSLARFSSVWSTQKWYTISFFWWHSNAVQLFSHTHSSSQRHSGKSHSGSLAL